MTKIRIGGTLDKVNGLIKKLIHFWIINTISKIESSRKVSFSIWYRKNKSLKLLFLGAVLFIGLGFPLKPGVAVEDSEVSLTSSSLYLSLEKKESPETLIEDALKIKVEEGVFEALPIKEIEIKEEEQALKTGSVFKQERRPREPIEYKVRRGDTISEIAKRFGLKTQTILWANGLKDWSIIRPGDAILIPPKDGIFYTVRRGDTLGEIVKRYQADLNEVIEYNQIDGDKIVQGQRIFLPDAKMPIYRTSKSRNYRSQNSTRTHLVKKSVPSRSVKITPKGCHRFPYGQCTWYVAQKWGCIPWSGNAKNWLTNARRYGYKTGSQPVPGAIIVTRESWYGHVGYVEKVMGNSVVISEMNKYGWGRVNRRTLNKNSWLIRGYIYPK